jgi:hypothetical protein
MEGGNECRTLRRQGIKIGGFLQQQETASTILMFRCEGCISRGNINGLWSRDEDKENRAGRSS